MRISLRLKMLSTEVSKIANVKIRRKASDYLEAVWARGGGSPCGHQRSAPSTDMPERRQARYERVALHFQHRFRR